MTMSVPVVSANAANPTRDIDTSAGYAGAAGLIAMQLAAKLTKRLDQSFSAGTTNPAAAVAGGSNTGAGTCSTVTAQTGDQVGTYTVTFTAPTAFHVYDPKGVLVGSGSTGTAFANQIGFTITAGSPAFVAGDSFTVTVPPAGACDVGSKGPNQSWTIFLIGPALSVGPASSLAKAVSSLAQTSGVATLTMNAAHPLGAGGTIVIGSTNGGINGFSGAAAISSVTTDAIVFANSGPDFAAAELPAVAWGYPVIAGFDVLASQSPDPAMPPGFSLKVPLAVVTTDSAGNIATVEPVQ